MKKYAHLIVVVLLSLQFIVFGLNKFLGFASPPPPTDAVALSFLGAMFGSYLGSLVGIIEVVGGILLLVPSTRFLGLLSLMPVVVNIVIFHLAHDNPGNGIWILSFLLYAVACIGKMSSFNQLFKIQ